MNFERSKCRYCERDIEQTYGHDWMLSNNRTDKRGYRLYCSGNDYMGTHRPGETKTEMLARFVRGSTK